MVAIWPPEMRADAQELVQNLMRNKMKLSPECMMGIVDLPTGWVGNECRLAVAYAPAELMF